MEKLKPIAKEDRRVVNVKNANYTPFISDGIEDGFVLQLGDSKPLGSGFHIYRMKPGQTTVAHKHQSDEEFYIIEGDLIDHDPPRSKGISNIELSVTHLPPIWDAASNTITE
jgi:hypothetical protein